MANETEPMRRQKKSVSHRSNIKDLLKGRVTFDPFFANPEGWVTRAVVTSPAKLFSPDGNNEQVFGKDAARKKSYSHSSVKMSE